MSPGTEFGLGSVRIGGEPTESVGARRAEADAGFALGAGLADRATPEQFAAALGGGEALHLSVASLTPLRRPPQAFLARSPTGDEVVVRVAAGAQDNALERTDGRPRMELRLEEAARTVFGADAKVVMSEGAEAAVGALSSAGDAGSPSVMPFVEARSGSGRPIEATPGVMVSGPGLIAYFSVDQRGDVSVSRVAQGQTSASGAATFRSDAIELDGQTVPLSPAAAERLALAIQTVADATGTQSAAPSLKDDMDILSLGGIPG